MKDYNCIRKRWKTLKQENKSKSSEFNWKEQLSKDKRKNLNKSNYLAQIVT